MGCYVGFTQCGICGGMSQSLINIKSLSLDTSQEYMYELYCRVHYPGSQGEVPKCCSELQPELWPVHAER